MEDQKRVFLAYRAIFDGEYAQLRKVKTIQQRVQKRSTPGTNLLLQQLGKAQVVGILRELLERKVFESESRARLTFPDLFTTTAAQEIQHNASEADAAKSEAEALGHVAALDGDEFNGEARDEIGKEPLVLPNTVPKHSTSDSLAIPFLYPIHIPYKVQHQILTRIQFLLENCCHQFTSQWFPSLISPQGWDCPEAIELNQWTVVIVERLGKLPSNCFATLSNGSPKSLAKTLLSVNSLRHSAVHRLRTTVSGISEFLRCAMRFADALRSSDCRERLEELLQEFESKVRALELNKNFLETKLEKELKVIARQRRELDEKENMAVATMVREDREYGVSIGDLLSQSVTHIFDRRANGGLIEADQGSRPEVEEKAPVAMDDALKHSASPDSTNGALRVPSPSEDPTTDPPELKSEPKLVKGGSPFPSLSSSVQGILVDRSENKATKGNSMNTINKSDSSSEKDQESFKIFAESSNGISEPKTVNNGRLSIFNPLKYEDDGMRAKSTGNSEREAPNLNDHVEFSQTFRLQNPMPKYLEEVLAKHKSKQKDVGEKGPPRTAHNALGASSKAKVATPEQTSPTTGLEVLREHSTSQPVKPSSKTATPDSQRTATASPPTPQHSPSSSSSLSNGAPGSDHHPTLEIIRVPSRYLESEPEPAIDSGQASNGQYFSRVRLRPMPPAPDPKNAAQKEIMDWRRLEVLHKMQAAYNCSELDDFSLTECLESVRQFELDHGE